MDSSNPVADSTRISIGSMKGRKERIARQNLAALETVLKGIRRTTFEELEPAPNDEDWEQGIVHAVRDYRSAWLDKIKTANSGSIDLSGVCNVHAAIPVSGLMVDGIAVHPPGVNDSKGFVSVNPAFGGAGLCPTSARALAHYFGVTDVSLLIREAKLYTKGTREGMKTRCKSQLSRPCVRLSKLGINKSKFFEIMDKRLPVRQENLPNWGDEINSQVELLYTSFNSSAGAPYWRKKVESVELLQHHILPLVVDALQNNTLDKLFAEQPELWLCTLKNKEDRYEDPVKKTRPYLALPWHWQALFSCLSQPYCRNMLLFHERRSCRNAYGFSYTAGGGNKIREHVLGMCQSDGDATYLVYGDDVDFYVHVNDRVYRICPDFKQMDGSVDSETIDWTIDHIINCYIKQHGDIYANFWKAVGEEWKMFATQPLMIVEGTTVYQKKSRDGLMTGVVGTTLFDTVKSVMAYEAFIEALKPSKGFFRRSLLKEENATKFFAEHGLVIKEGTWTMEEVQLAEHPGKVWTSQKFLGMQMKYELLENGRTTLVPTLPTGEWLKMFMTPKRDEFSGTIARVARDRYLFDRMRGLLTTGAIFDDRVRKAFNGILRHVDSVAIVMEVQACNGKGAQPELVKVVGEDFSYSTSMGWPTYEWALDLYAAPEDRVGYSMENVFQCDEAVFRKAYKRPEIRLDACVVDVATPMGVETSIVLAEKKVIPDTPPIQASLMPTEVSVCKHDKVNPRSKLVDLKDPSKNPKHKPTLQESIRVLMQPQPLASARVMLLMMEDYLSTGKLRSPIREKLLRPDIMLQMVQFLVDFAPQTLFEDWWGTLTQHMIWPVNEISGILGVSQLRIEQEARKLGYYVVGKPTNRWLVGVPLAGVNALVRKQLDSQEKENVQKLHDLRKEVKEATVEKATKLKQQEQSLKAVISRSVQKPALANIEQGARALPPLQKVPNLVIPESLPPDRLRIVASDILYHNRLRVRRTEERDGDGWVHTFVVNGKPVLNLFKFAGKQAWLHFYQLVVNTYKKDNLRPQKGESWADAAEREASAMVRIYKTSAGPILIQQSKTGPVELLAKHEKLVEVIAPEGKRVAVNHEGQQIQLVLRSGTLLSRAKRLEKFLGEPVTFETAPLNEFVSRFELVAHYYDRKKQAKRKSKSPKTQNRGQGRREGRETKTSKGTPSTWTTKPADDYDLHPQSERQRLFRYSYVKSNRQNRSPKRTSLSNAPRVARDSGGTRGPTMAKVETYKSPVRGNNQRQQDDGGSVHSVLDRRSRR